MIVADAQVSLVLTGTGDVLEPEAGVAAHRFGRHVCARRRPGAAGPEEDPEAIVRRSLEIAADICVYTNRNLTVESIG